MLRGEPLPLGPRVVATLVALVERSGDVVTKDEILDAVWSGEDVGESNVAQSVYTMRKVLRAHGLAHAIVTVPRRGYRFVATVEQLGASPAPARTPVRRLERRRPFRRGWVALGAVVLLALIGSAPPVRALPHAAPLSARGAELYRLGRYYWNLRTPAALAKSERLFGAVVASDPHNALGYSGLADAELMMADYRSDHVKPALHHARARARIGTALALDPLSAAAHTSLAMLRFAAGHDGAGSEREFRRAIELDPGYAVAHHWLGTTLVERGRIAEAARELHAAAALDPVSPSTGAWLAEVSYYTRRYGDAVTYERRALDLDPQRGGARRTLGLAYELAGDLRRAIAVFERMRYSRLDSDAAAAPALLAEAYARVGRTSEARTALRDAVRIHPTDDDTGFALLALGERVRGFAVLARMRSAGKKMSLQDPRLDPFRDALRTAAVRRKPTV